MKDFDELTQVDNPAWPLVLEWMQGADSVRIVATDAEQRRATDRECAWSSTCSAASSGLSAVKRAVVPLAELHCMDF